jgi:endo-1,4-beta-xylanase
MSRPSTIAKALTGLSKHGILIVPGGAVKVEMLPELVREMKSPAQDANRVQGGRPGARTNVSNFLRVFLVAGVFFASGPSTAETVALKSAAAARHRYFGAALNPAFLVEPVYRELATSQFSSITPEDAMKWRVVEPVRGAFDWTAADEVAAFAKSNGQKLRGHNLLWEGYLPSWLAGERFAPAAFKELIEDHITAEVSRYKGAVYAWDVINEPFDDAGHWRAGLLHDTLGDDYVAIALRAARAADPDAKLYINDSNIEASGPKFFALYHLVAALKTSGVPIDGVGLQSHFIAGRVPPGLPAILAKFAALDIDIAITELDLRVHLPATPESLAQQAAGYRFVVASCLAVARCVGITTWGISDDHSWIPRFFPGYGDALLFDRRGDLKSAYAAVIAAFRSEKPPTFSGITRSRQKGDAGSPAARRHLHGRRLRTTLATGLADGTVGSTNFISPTAARTAGLGRCGHRRRPGCARWSEPRELIQK